MYVCYLYLYMYIILILIFIWAKLVCGTAATGSSATYGADIASPPRQILKPFRDHFLALPGSKFYSSLLHRVLGIIGFWV